MRKLDRILVTGGAGFIGSAFIRFLFRLSDSAPHVVNLDVLTYSANLELLKAVDHHPRYRFIQGDINDQTLIESILAEEEIDAVVHFAAQTHVDRSIASAAPFIETNVKGTMALLEAVRQFPEVHFHHVSTDEVYGALGESGAFNEQSPYRPNSPYAASKAASDHLVRAYANTYNLSTTISHCSNNYGPGQYPEKLIPLMILAALAKKPLPVYGRGHHVRDWLYVDDHAEGLWRILCRGQRHQTYDMGGLTERSNLDLIRHLLEIIADETHRDVRDLNALVRFVEDRPGHDYRYAIDISKIKRELGWEPKIEIQDGLRKTVRWYLKAQVSSSGALTSSPP
ncbi:MAG: rfbB [Parachlamydiales bacterium]|nr:rfbB [Parachlamydiales bacterium]